MGIADLTGPRAKLGRANEHLNIFDKEFRAFFTRKPESAVIEFRREEGWHVAYVNPLPLLPMRFALIAGDCLNNLRVALDHLVWQLVLREDQNPTYTHHFPACETWEKFRDEVKSPPTKRVYKCPLRGIPVDGDAWTIIEKAQPFKRPKPQDDVLFLLARMNNFDKHKTLLVQRTLPDLSTIAKCVRWNRNFQLIDQETILSFISPTREQPTKILRYRFAPEGNPGMYVKGEFYVYPTLGDGETQWSVDMLKAGCERVQKILDEVAALPGVKNVPTPVYFSAKKRR